MIKISKLTCVIKTSQVVAPPYSLTHSRMVFFDVTKMGRVLRFPPGEWIVSARVQN
jgi:hypothetical protein